MIHVALAFHDHDGKLCIACRSCIFRRTASPVTALLHDAGLTPVGKARLATVAEYFGQSLRLHAVPEPPPEIAAGLPPQFGPGSLYRLHLPRLLDEEQVIYLDCDVCCTLDIRELWEEATQEQSRCCPACAIRRPKARAGNSEKRPGPCALLQQRRTGLSSAPPARLVSGSHGRCPAPFARIVPPPALSGSGRSEPALPPSAVALAGGTLQLSCTWPDAGCCRRTSLKAACSTSVAVNRGASRSALRLSAIWRITVSWSNVALKNEIIHPGKSLIFTGQLHGGAGNAPAAQPHQLT